MIKINDETWRYVQVNDSTNALGGVQHLFAYIDGQRLENDDPRRLYRFASDDGATYWVFRVKVGSEVAFTTDAPDASDGYYFNVYASGIKIMDASSYGIYHDYEHSSKFRVYDTMEVSIQG